MYYSATVTENGRMDIASVLDITSVQLANSYPSVLTDYLLEEGEINTAKFHCEFQFYLKKIFSSSQ